MTSIGAFRNAAPVERRAASLTKGSPRVLRWHLAALFGLALAFLVFRVADTPATWYDEGLNLNAARTLLETRVLGLTSVEGLRAGDPAVQTGTPVLVPLAALTALFGPSIILSRLLIVVFSMVALAAFTALATRLYGTLAGLLAITALLVFPGDAEATFLGLGRQVLGETPAMLCMSLGLLLLIHAKNTYRRSAFVGLLFGLAALIKSQVLLILVATTGLWFLYSVAARKRDRRHRAVVLAVMLAVFVLDALWKQSSAGPRLEMNAATLREGVFIHILPFRGSLNLAETGVFARLLLVLGAVGATLAIRRIDPFTSADAPASRRVENFLMLFVTLWIVWFAFISIGWRRYAFMGVTFATPLIGHIAARVWAGVRIPNNLPAHAGVLAVTLLAMIFGTKSWLLNDRQGRQFNKVVDYLNASVPPDATVLSWDWSISYLGHGRYSFPSTHACSIYTANLFLGWPPDPSIFDPLASCPDYVLVNGGFLPDTLHPAVAAAQWPPVLVEGPYRLFQIDSSRVRRLPDGRCEAR